MRSAPSTSGSRPCHRLRRPGGDGGQQREARSSSSRPAAPSWRARSASWRRSARSARRSTPASTSTNVLSTIAKHAVRLSATDGGSIMEYDRGRAVLPGPERLPDRAERRSSVCGPPGSTSTRRWSAAPRSSDGRWRSRTSAPPSSIRTSRSCTTPAGGRWSRYRCCERGRSSARWSSAVSGPASSPRRPLDAAGDVRRPVGAGPAQRPVVPRAGGAQRGARGGQPAQVRVPGEHVPRAADAAERGTRILRGAAGADVRRAQRTPGGVPARHPRLGQAPARTAERDPRPVQGRGRPDGTGVLDVRAARGCSTTRPSMLRERAAVHGIELRRRGRAEDR